MAEVRQGVPWRRWGPYLSERQWGTVREDYSEDGNAWDYFPHDHARSRAYRWGEDGIAGFGDDQLHLCLGLALWNGQRPDPQGAAVRPDQLAKAITARTSRSSTITSTPRRPTPRCGCSTNIRRRAFPMRGWSKRTGRRGTDEPEFELLDTGVFDDDRYFDVEIEYAKAAPDDILMRDRSRPIAVPNAAPLHVLPQLWARNTWSWKPGVAKPHAARAPDPARSSRRTRGYRRCGWSATERPNCCSARTRPTCGGSGARMPPGISRTASTIMSSEAMRARGQSRAGRHQSRGSLRLLIPGGASAACALRLMPYDAAGGFDDFDGIIARRRAEADAFYAALQRGHRRSRCAPRAASGAGRHAVVETVLLLRYPGMAARRPVAAAAAGRPPAGRNADWEHLNNADIVSMPDKWEYPWYAAWDLAFHCITLAHDRSRFRQGPAPAADARVVHAPERPAAGL